MPFIKNEPIIFFFTATLREFPPVIIFFIYEIIL